MPNAVSGNTASGTAPIVPRQPGLTVSRYDRVAASLLAGVSLVVAATAALLAVWWGNSLPSRPAALPVLPIIVDDEFGGRLDGEENSSMEIPGEITPYVGLGLEELDEPPVERSLELLDSVVAARELMLADPVERAVWDSRKGAFSGTPGNAPALGEGPGFNPGVERPLRWRIQFDDGGSIEDYARQLDYFQIELGILGGDSEVRYCSSLAGSAALRTAAASAEERLYFVWQDGARQEADRELLARAGVDGSGKKIMQFFPAATENLLANIEDAYLKRNAPQRSIKGVFRTFFAVVPDGDGYAFVVTRQTYLNSRRHRGL